MAINTKIIAGFQIKYTKTWAALWKKAVWFQTDEYNIQFEQVENKYNLTY